MGCSWQHSSRPSCQQPQLVHKLLSNTGRSTHVQWVILPLPLLLVPAGTGVDLAVQTMAAGPYGLLLSNVHVGYGSRPWGAMATVQLASSFMTVWNLNSQAKVGMSQ